MSQIAGQRSPSPNNNSTRLWKTLQGPIRLPRDQIQQTQRDPVLLQASRGDEGGRERAHVKIARGGRG